MLLRKSPDIKSSEITDKKLYLRRREFIQAAAMTTAGAAAGTLGIGQAEAQSWPRVKIPGTIQNSGWGKGEKLNEYQDIATYNNFYEFGTEKGDPAVNAHTLKTTPWKVKIDGLVGKPADYNLEDIVKPQALEERIYRLRCVERWSMVIPWVGFPLASLLKRIEPASTAKFVEFTTLLNPQQMPGQRRAGARVAVHRRTAARRGDAPAHDSRGRTLRRIPAEPERRAHQAGRALEVRLQEHQVDRAHPADRSRSR